MLTFILLYLNFKLHFHFTIPDKCNFIELHLLFEY